MACFMFRVRYVWDIGLTGDIELWYCAHCNVYELRYDVQFYTPDGLGDATASCSYDAVDYTLTDAIELADTPLCLIMCLRIVVILLI